MNTPNVQAAPVTAGGYLTKPEVARMFRITPRTLDQWQAAGRLPFFKLGRTVRYKLSDIEAHLATHCKRGAM